MNLWILWNEPGKTSYTIRDCVLSDIACDDNGAYNETNKVVVDENGVQAVKQVHESKDRYFYKKHESWSYIDLGAHTEDVYTLDGIIGIAKLCLNWTWL